ncbi:MAG: PAS domain S-box protein [Oscillatoria princeps RMCB-10]|jgi:PAS domain S-box-containing protein|nr:PAS domain S-box protein [Oscillatoria princeps RMCB-10]
MKAMQMGEESFIILDRVPIGSCVLREDFTVLFWNACLEEWTKIPRSQILGRSLLAHFPHLNDPKYASRLQQIFQGGLPSIFSSQLHKYVIPSSLPDGQPRIQHTTVTAIPAENGSGFYALFSIEDVTDLTRRIENYRRMRDQALEEVRVRQEAEKALRESEARVRRLVESNIIGIILADFKGNLHEANDAFLQIGGYDRQDFVAGKVRWTDMTPEKYRHLDERAIEQVKASGACNPYEKEFSRPDGSRVSVLVGIALLEGVREQFVAFVLDITERKQLEERLRQQAGELAQANRMKDEFIAVVSHELRTPLNSMLGWAQLIRTQRLNETTVKKAMESIERNAKAQVKIIDDILDVSRIIRGKIRLNTRQVDLIPVIQAVVEDINPAAKDKGIQIETAIESSACHVLGDSDRLQQIFWNLLSNAVKFTPEKGRVEIRLSVGMGHGAWGVGHRASEVAHGSEENPQCFMPGASSQMPHAQPPTPFAQIQISDTGTGIAPEFLPHVFERFRQADSTTTRAYGGLGLGLEIARTLVELHGGTVTAASEGKGKGATFTVRLPFAPATANLRDNNLSQLELEGESEASVNQGAVLGGTRVLVVDDDPDTRELIGFVLKHAGARVVAVSGAGVALEALQSFHPDVLVSDIGMPGEDGYMLIRQVRALEAGQNRLLPAVALTAYAKEEDRRQALLAGYQSHVPKPVEPEDLVAVVASLAGGSGKAEFFTR